MKNLFKFFRLSFFLSMMSFVTSMSLDAATISGYVYEDESNSCSYDAGYAGLEDILITLLGPSGFKIELATDADGYYSFDEIPSGVYTVSTGDVPAGYSLVGQSVYPFTVESDVDDQSFHFCSIASNLLGEILGSVIWESVDCNNLITAGEDGFQGVPIYLYDNNDNIVSVATSDASGNFQFNDLYQGNYVVSMQVLEDYFTPGQGSYNITLIGDAPSAGISFIICEIPDVLPNPDDEQEDQEDNNTVPCDDDLAEISGYAFIDLNGDCINDLNESGLADVVISLFGPDGFKMETTCDEDGHYSFGTLPAGSYTVEVSSINDEYTLVSLPGAAIVLDPCEVIEDVNFCYGNADDLGCIKGFVFSDANADGLYDNDETELEGISIYLIDADNNFYIINTAADGSFEFSDLTPGSYTVQVGNLSAFNSLTTTGEFDVEVITGDCYILPSIGIGQDCDGESGVISGYAFLDSNGNCIFESEDGGIEGYEVNLFGPDGFKLTTYTDETGYYEFTGLNAGYFSVHIGDNTDSWELVSLPIVTISIEDCESYSNANFCYIGEEEIGSIAGLIFIDTNGDGVYDADEGEYEGLTLILTDSFGNSTLVVSDSDGTFDFSGLPAGDYTVEVTNVPEGYELTSPESFDITLAAGEAAILPEIGLRPICDGFVGSISGYAYADLASDCTMDTEDLGLAGIEIELYGPDGLKIVVTTNENGYYEFTGLEAGMYTVALGSEAAGYIPGSTTFYALTLLVCEEYQMANFCFYPAQELGIIKGSVFEDSNGNALFDDEESGLTGITVYLYDSNNNIIGFQNTNENGEYQFDDLPAGNYTVQVGDGPDSYTITTDGTEIVGLDSGITYEVYPFGFAPPVIEELGSIWGYVFHDQGDDCLYANDPGLEGIEVSLYGPDGFKIVTYTEADGSYHFEDIPAGLYSVVVGEVPDGYILNGLEYITISLEAGEHADNINFCYNMEVELGSIAGHVFYDANGDGICDDFESFMSGVSVLLYDDNSNIVGVATTDQNGAFIFEDLPAGNYTVEVGNGPLGSILTTDASFEVSLGEGENVADIKFGFVIEQEPELASLWGFAYVEQDGVCNHDANDAGLEGILITLVGENGLALTTFTDATGAYHFEDIPAGPYTVLVGLTPNGYNLISGESISVDLEPGEHLMDVNFCFEAEIVQPVLASIWGNVYVITDGNCTNNAGDPTLENILVNLTDASGFVLSTFTAADGSYHFENIQAGNYTISVGDAGGYTLVSPNDLPVSVAAGEHLENVNFCFEAIIVLPDPSSIWGYVHVVPDGNCNYNPADPALENILVNLTDASGFVLSTFTDANGAYHFENIAAGNYTVSVGDASGYSLVSPNDLTVSIAVGEHLENVNFCFEENIVPPLQASVWGHVFVDPDGNCTYNGNDQGLNNILVTLTDASGFVLSTVTSADGSYHFEDVTPGYYTVSVGDAPGYILVSVGNLPISLASGEHLDNVNFCYEAEPVILNGGLSGQVFLDENGNGICELNEAGIYGTSVQLLDASGNVISIAFTDSNGEYVFNNLPAGTYSVVVGSGPDGTELTTAGSFTYNLGQGEFITEIKFGFTDSGECASYTQCFDQTACTEAQTSIELCPNWCCDGTAVIIDVVSNFDCGIQILPNGCVVYTPLPGMEVVGYDYVNMTAQDSDGNCYTLHYEITIGNCNPVVCSPSAGNIQIVNSTVCEWDNVEVYLAGGQYVPDGFTKSYLMTNPYSGQIIQTSTTGNLSGVPQGYYEIYCVVFNPSEVNISNYAYINDLQAAFQDNGGPYCGDLGQFPAEFNSENCCQAQVCNLYTTTIVHCIGSSITASAETQAIIPTGYVDAFILANVNGQILEISSSPTFVPNAAGLFSIHHLVYNPANFNPSSASTITGLNNLLNQGGGSICASLELDGAQFIIEECDDPDPVCQPEVISDCIPALTPLVICPEFCTLYGPITITDVHTTFDCGIQIQDPGCVVYTALPLFSGLETLQITACMSNGICETVTANITVGDCNGNQGPIVVDDNYNSNSNGGPIVLDVLSNDYDPDGDQVYFCNTANDLQVQNGTLTVTETGFIYVPYDGFVGTETFTYTICDGNGGSDSGTVTLVILPEGCTSNQVLCTEPYAGPESGIDICIDFCGDGMVVSDYAVTYDCNINMISENCFRFVPFPLFVGENVIEILGCNNAGQCETAIIQIAISDDCDGQTNQNFAPIIGADNYSTSVNTSTNLDVLSNDSDPDGGNISICGYEQPVNGQVSLFGDFFIYTPNDNFSGIDSFTYSVCDNTGSSSTGTVYVNVAQACGETEAVCLEPYILTPSSIEICVEFCTAGLTISDHNTVYDCDINYLGNNCFTYAPMLGFEGEDVVEIIGCNNGNVCETVIVNVMVSRNCDNDFDPFIGGNNPPIATDDHFNGAFDDILLINLIYNDMDPDEYDEIEVCSVTNGQHGTVTILDGGVVSFEIGPGFLGSDQFTYTVCDGNGGEDEGIVDINVLGSDLLNLFAYNDYHNVDGGNTLTMDVIANDLYDCDPTVNLLTPTENYSGSAVLDGNQIVYVPELCFYGTIYLVYEICCEGGCSQGSITINIFPAASCDGGRVGLRVPNVFSPNNDGVNDAFKVGVEDSYTELDISELEGNMSIFNQFGQVIYQNSGAVTDIEWNGQIDNNGNELSEGTYFYYMEIAQPNSTEIITGSIDLRR